MSQHLTTGAIGFAVGVASAMAVTAGITAGVIPYGSEITPTLLGMEALFFGLIAAILAAVWRSKPDAEEATA
jgi:hypothetical protein